MPETSATQYPTSDHNYFTLLNSEYQSLTQEITQIQQGQVQLLIGTASASAIFISVIIGLISGQATDIDSIMQTISTQPFRTILMLPLLFIIPSMTIFFYQETQVSKKNAFLKIIEDNLLGENRLTRYIGYENYRGEWYNNTKERTKLQISNLSKRERFFKFFDILSAKRVYRFWIMSYYAYIGLIAFVTGVVVCPNLFSVSDSILFNPTTLLLIVEFSIIVTFRISANLERNKKHNSIFFAIYAISIFIALIIGETYEIKDILGVETDGLAFLILYASFILINIYQLAILYKRVSNTTHIAIEKIDRNMQSYLNNSLLFMLTIIFIPSIILAYSSLFGLINFYFAILSIYVLIWSFEIIWNLSTGGKESVAFHVKYWEQVIETSNNTYCNIKREESKYGPKGF